MAIALVGAVGAITTAGAAAVTPAFAQATTAGNLLIGIVLVNNTGAITVTGPTGWVQAASVNNSSQSAIWYKPNCSASETAPTFNSTSATVMKAYLAEFSGVKTVSPLDKTGTGTATTSPVAATAGAADTAAADLVISSSAWRNTAATTGTISHSAGYNQLNDDGSASSTAHVAGAYRVLTSGGVSADTDSTAYTGAVSAVAACIASFLAVAAAVATVVPQPRAMDGSRAITGLRRRAKRFDVVPAQVNPPYPTSWHRPFLSSPRSIAPRRAKRAEVVPPQFNPPMPPTWWKRPILIAARSLAPRRAKRFEVTPPQASPVMPPNWWRRPFIVALRSVGPRRARRFEAPRPQVNPPMPPMWWKRPFVGTLHAIGPRRARRFDVTPPQVNPPFSTDWWRPRRVLRPFIRRARLANPPWTQVAVVVATFVAWPSRLRRMTGWLRRRGSSAASTETLAPLTAPRRRAVALSRRARRFESITTAPLAITVTRRISHVLLALRRQPAPIRPDGFSQPTRSRRPTILPLPRRARRAEPIAVQIVAAPAFVEWWRRVRRGFPRLLRRSRRNEPTPASVVAPVTPSAGLKATIVSQDLTTSIETE